jgi:hypothetical protein
MKKSLEEAKKTIRKETPKERKLRKDFPVYPDKPLRDVLGPQPSKKTLPSGPVLRGKDGKIKRALLAKGGMVKK